MDADDELEAAVRDAYRPEGQRIWWQAYAAADDAHRRRMAYGVLADGNG